MMIMPFSLDGATTQSLLSPELEEAFDEACYFEFQGVTKVLFHGDVVCHNSLFEAAEEHAPLPDESFVTFSAPSAMTRDSESCQISLSYCHQGSPLGLSPATPPTSLATAAPSWNPSSLPQTAGHLSADYSNQTCWLSLYDNDSFDLLAMNQTNEPVIQTPTVFASRKRRSPEAQASPSGASLENWLLCDEPKTDSQSSQGSPRLSWQSKRLRSANRQEGWDSWLSLSANRDSAGLPSNHRRVSSMLVDLPFSDKTNALPTSAALVAAPDTTIAQSPTAAQENQENVPPAGQPMKKKHAGGRPKNDLTGWACPGFGKTCNAKGSGYKLQLRAGPGVEGLCNSCGTAYMRSLKSPADKEAYNAKRRELYANKNKKAAASEPAAGGGLPANEAYKRKAAGAPQKQGRRRL